MRLPRVRIIGHRNKPITNVSLSGGVEKRCAVFTSIKIEGLRHRSLSRLLKILQNLDGPNTDPRFSRDFSLELGPLVIPGVLFNPSSPGHELSLEMRYLPESHEIVVMRWITVIEKGTGRVLSHGTDYSLTGKIGEFIKLKA